LFLLQLYVVLDTPTRHWKLQCPLYYTTFKQWQWMVARMAPKLSKTFQKTKQKVLSFTTFPFSISKLFFFSIFHICRNV
jgi:hypothetical protein